MQRNHSDLGSRIRKRVTYRLHSSPVCPSAQEDKHFLQEHNIPRSLSESYPSRTKFCESENPVIDSTKTVTTETEESQSEPEKVKPPVSSHVLVIPQTTFPMDPGKALDSPSSSDCFELSNSQHSLLDDKYCDPFSPEDETKTLLKEVTNSSNQNQTNNNQSKSQESEHTEVCYQDDNHRVLVPVGSMKALSADVSDV